MKRVATVLVVAGALAGCGVAASQHAHSGQARAASITIEPSRGLSPGERVRVRVRGFPAWGKVFLSECARARDAGPLGCGPQLAAQPFLLADGHGRANGRFTIQAVAATGPLAQGARSAKCALGPGCVLIATIGIPADGHRAVAATPIRFALPPPAPPPLPVTLPRGAPLTVLRRIKLPAQAWLLAVGAGGLFVLSENGSGAMITRVDPAGGQAGPSRRVTGAANMVVGASNLALGGNLVWVVRQAPSRVTPPLLALSPATLAVVHRVVLPDQPGWGGDVAYAGGLIWVAGTHLLMGIDPAAGRLTVTVPLEVTADTGAFTSVAATADSTALWTAEGTGGGGPIGVQQRDPRTGAVLESAYGPFGGIGGARIAAAPGRVWLAYASGMLGGYFRVNVRAGGLTETEPKRSQMGHGVFSNGVQVFLAYSRLWILDQTSISCADDTTGRILWQLPGSSGYPSSLVPLAPDRLALAWGGEILIVRPRPPCGP